MRNSPAILSRYGALELKRAYRRNLGIGIATAVFLQLAVIGGMMIMGCGQTTPLESQLPPVSIDSLPPQSIEIDFDDDIEVFRPPKRSEYTSGPIVAVADSQVQESDIDVPTLDELDRMIRFNLINSIDEIGNRPIEITNPLSDNIPGPDTFIPFEEAPVIIENARPEYPRIAQQAGLTGEVWINVLIGKDGTVRNVRILKSSTTDVGFEEAAMQAAYKTLWKPAISNGQPIAEWTSYKVIFALKGK